MSFSVTNNIQTSLRLPKHLHDALRAQAERSRRTISGELTVMLEQHLDAAPAPKQGPAGFDYNFAAQGGRV